MISVIVPAHDAERALPALLEALAAQTLDRAEWELVLADDGSRDGTAAVAEASGLGRVVRSARRSGSYAARNLALRSAVGDVLAFTDADCRPEPGWLECGRAGLDAGLDLAAGAIAIERGPRPTLAEAIDRAAGLDQRRYVEELGFGATANLFVRRAVVEAVGPFNEKLVSGGDVEFCRRATAAGHRLGYCDGARVRHEPRSRARQLVRQSFRVGYGLGQWPHVAAGAAREGESASQWRSPRAWRPRRLPPGIERLEERPSPARAAALGLAHYAWVQLPRNAGNLAAWLRRGRGL